MLFRTTIAVVIPAIICFSNCNINKHNLVYSIHKTMPYVESDKRLYLYNIIIQNKSENTLNDIDCEITFKKGYIEKSEVRYRKKITPRVINHKQYFLKVKNLKPKEKFTITLFSTSDLDDESSIKVYL